MKIVLTQDIPVDPRHGLIAGREMDAVRHGIVHSGSVAYTVVGDGVEEVGILRSEATVVKKGVDMKNEISVFFNEADNFAIFSGDGGDIVLRGKDDVWLLSPSRDDVKLPADFLSLAILYISIPEV
jgi:hypothetical protein